MAKRLRAFPPSCQIWCEVANWCDFMKNIFTILIASLAIFTTGCAPELGLKVAPPDVPSQLKEDKEKTPKAEAKPLMGVKVRVSPLLDGRSSDTIVMIDGRSIPSEGPVGVSAQAGLERQIREAGGRIAVLQSSTIEGEVVEWLAKVKPSFPLSDVSAKAKIKITVRDAQQKVLYRGTYGGEANKRDPFLGERDVQEALGDAMARAISAAVADEVMAQQLMSAGRK